MLQRVFKGKYDCSEAEFTSIFNPFPQDSPLHGPEIRGHPPTHDTVLQIVMSDCQSTSDVMFSRPWRLFLGRTPTCLARANCARYVVQPGSVALQTPGKGNHNARRIAPSLFMNPAASRTTPFLGKLSSGVFNLSASRIGHTTRTQFSVWRNLKILSTLLQTCTDGCAGNMNASYVIHETR